MELFFNGTHFGFGEDYVYSSTSPVSYALYASIFLAVLVVSCSCLIHASVCGTRRRIIRDAAKKEALLHEQVDELVERFQSEVKNSEVLIYDEELSNHSQECDVSTDGDDTAAEAPMRGPPVVDGFYSITQDDPYLEYNEDMYLEFIPNQQYECKIRGFGKYDNGNFRVEGLVSSTGEAYWYEVSYGTAGLPTVILSRGRFTRQTEGRTHFSGQWYSEGKVRGPYHLFSHKAVFPSTNDTVPSVAESTEVMECSIESMGDTEEEDGLLNDNVSSQTVVEFGDAGPGADIMCVSSSRGNKEPSTSHAL